MYDRALGLGVRIETGARIDALPEPPVIVATELSDARRLLGDAGLFRPARRVRRCPHSLRRLPALVAGRGTR